MTNRLTSCSSRNRLIAILKSQEKGQYIVDVPDDAPHPAATKRKLPPILKQNAKKAKTENAGDEATLDEAADDNVSDDEISGGETAVNEVEDTECKLTKGDTTVNSDELEPLLRIARETLEGMIEKY
jgi:hypothetical protein